MWSLAGSQAVDQPICYLGPGLLGSWLVPTSGPESHGPVDPAALGLSHSGLRGRFEPESRSPWVPCFGPVVGAACLSSRCAPT